MIVPNQADSLLTRNLEDKIYLTLSLMAAQAFYDWVEDVSDSF